MERASDDAKRAVEKRRWPARLKRRAGLRMNGAALSRIRPRSHLATGGDGVTIPDRAAILATLLMLAACGQPRSDDAMPPPSPSTATAAPAVATLGGSRFRLAGRADAPALAAAVELARHGMSKVSATPAQSFRIMDGERHVATLVSGEGLARDASYLGCFTALVQNKRASMVSTIGSGEWEAETCGGTIAVGILSIGETVAIGVLAQAFSPNAEAVEPVVLQWDPATGGLSIDQALSKRASLAGATSIDAIRRATTTAAGNAGSAVLPDDIRAFARRRDVCDHLRGENTETAEAVDRLERACRGTDAELARLRARHESDAAVSTALAAYDPQVE